MIAILRLYTDIALLRRGPEDVPASGLLLAATVAGYLVVNVVLRFVLPIAPSAWFAQLAAMSALTLAWYALLLRLFGRSERFLQTATAVFGYQMILTPPVLATQWLLIRAENNSETLLVFMALLALAMFAWLLAAGARVLRAAIEQPLFLCIGILLLELLVSQLLLQMLFGAPVGT